MISEITQKQRKKNMGTKWFTGGVVAAPRGRIQFDFRLDGVRYRPSIKRPPSESNLRRARERLETIKRQIAQGIFSFAEEFPDYRFLRRLTGASKARLCDDVCVFRPIVTGDFGEGVTGVFGEA